MTPAETTKDRRLAGYLLGQGSDAERAEIEDRLFADDALFEYLAAVETDLIDAFVREEIAPADRAAFETRFFGPPRLRMRIDLARWLQYLSPPIDAANPAPQAAAAAPLTPAASAPAAAPSATRRPATSPSTMFGVVAVLGVAVAIGAGWWALQSSRPQPAGTPAPQAPVAQTAEPAPVAAPAAAPEPALDELHQVAEGPVALVLAPGSAGSGASNAVLRIPAGADSVHIQIDHAGAARERYAVVVVTRDGQRVWTELSMPPRAPGASGVILDVPAASLPAGEYLLTLSGGALRARRLDALADYTVRVE